MPNVINELIVKELSSSVEEADGMLVATFTGLTVAESEDLRDSLAEHGLRLRMVRNRLVKLALKAHDIEPPAGLFAGNIACVWGGPEDTINAAKVLHKSDARKQGKVALRGGLMEGNVIGEGEAQALADMPGRDELRAMLLGVISGPARGLVGTLAAVPGGLARVIQAHVDSGDAGGAAQEAGAPEPVAPDGTEAAAAPDSPDAEGTAEEGA